MKRLCFFVGIFTLAALLMGQADGPDDQFIRVYRLIKQADDLNESQQWVVANEKYLEAQTALKRLQTANPTWNQKVVQFRLNYLSEKLTQLASKHPEAQRKDSNPPPPSAIKPPVINEFERQVQSLKDELQRLTADRAVLEAKLKEALSAQPAAVDPREVAKAQEKIRSLQKENEVLQISLSQQQAKLDKLIDPLVHGESQKALAEANRRLAEQEKIITALKREKPAPVPGAAAFNEKERLEALRKDNESLKKQVAELKLKAEAATKLDDLNRQLRQAKAEFEAQKSLNEILRTEKKTLERELAGAQKNAKASEAALANLQKEKNALEQRLANQSSTPIASSPSETNQLKRLARERDKLEKDLASAREIAKKNQATLADIKKEKSILEARLAKESATVDKANTADAERIKRLERERNDLQKKLNVTSTKVAKKSASDSEQQLRVEVASLRARLEVLEARKIPFTPEELALFKTPEPKLATTDSAESKEAKPSKKSSRDVPTGAGALVAEAQRAFASRRYDEAEKKYTEVLRLDEKNVFTLANLAAIQMEQNRLPEAEANLKQALKEAPKDAYSLSLFGILKFRQDKFDDAFDALSHAAQIDPQNAETQNYLGITLSQKGQRGPAEAALRKAIQLMPGYGSAHHNLAVIYVTQQPPFTELARWHYQKALAGGQPRNPDLEKLLDNGKSASGGK